MRKIAYLLVGIILIFLPKVRAQAPTFGSAKVEQAADLTATDNGFVLLGTAQNSGFNFDIWSVFTDTLGNFLAEKRYGGQKKDIAAQITATNNGFFILGTTYSSELPGYHGRGDFLLVKTNASGDQIWRRVYGGAQLDQATAIVGTGDGGALLVGSTHSSDISSYHYGQGDILIIKVDAAGNVQWAKTFGGSKTDMPGDIQATPDGGYILTGTTFSADGLITNNNGQSDIWVLKITHAGMVEWSKSFGGAGFDYGHALRVVPTGGYIIVGSMGSINTSTSSIAQRYDQDLIALRIDETGQTIWQKTFGHDYFDAGMDVYPLNDGSGFLLTGYTEDAAPGSLPYESNKNAWTLGIDPQGNKLWEIFAEGSENEYGVAIGANASKSTVAVIGDTDSKDGELISTGRKDIWFQKYNDQSTFTVSLGSDFGICAGKSITLQATVPNCPDCTYLWENNSTQDVRPVTVTTTKVYSVTVTNPSGQTISDSIHITVFPNPTASVVKGDPFNGESNGYIIVTPQSGTPPYQITWDNGAIDFFINHLDGGNYHFSMTDQNGCAVDSTVYLEEVVSNQDFTKQISLSIFPNPIPQNTALNIQSSNRIKNIKIYNSNGLLLKTVLSTPQNIPLEALPKGVYYLLFTLQQGQKYTKRLQIY